MFTEALLSSGGNPNIKTGYFDVSSTSEVPVTDVGFKPSFLSITRSGVSSNYEVNVVFDKSKSPDTQDRMYLLNGSAWTSDTVTMPYTQDAITDLLDNGFQWKASSNSWYGRYFYVAVS